MDSRTARSTRFPDTRQQVLDEAEHLVQTRGFNGFSYADIAATLGVTKASLHYHFPSKAELGRQLIQRYRERFQQALDRIEAGGGGPCRELEAYVAVYEGVLADGRMCLCGMLAAEYGTLPEPMRESLAEFFRVNEAWLARLFERGRSSGSLAFRGDPREAANAFMGALEGAMLVARAHGGLVAFTTSARMLVENFCRSRAAERAGT